MSSRAGAGLTRRTRGGSDESSVRGDAPEERREGWLDVRRLATVGGGLFDGHPFRSSFMAMGDGMHKLPVKADVRKAIGKEAGDLVAVRIEERLGA